jgi:hypothetical protein
MSVTAAGLVFLIAAGPLLAQATLGTAAAAGTIRDSSGALVPGAVVTLTDKARGSIRESESDSAGAFLIPSVIAGLYSLEVRKEGFSVARIDSVKIDVGALASFEVTLRLEGLRTGITVSPSSNAEIAGDSSRIASVVDSGRVQELPLNGRNLLQLALLAAGTVETAPASDVFGTNVGTPARTIVLPGMMPHSASYSINGINIRGSRVGELALNPSVAAVDQFSVEESFLMPGEGSNAVVVNIVTKSGTNQLHGEVFEFLRNRALDARSFFSSGPEDLKRNQFGFALGGPLYKDRAWFHAFYEGLREITGFSSAAYTPTAAMFRGDFPAAGRAIFDPASYVAESGTAAAFSRFQDSREPDQSGSAEPAELLLAGDERRDAAKQPSTDTRCRRSMTTKAACGWTSVRLRTGRSCFSSAGWHIETGRSWRCWQHTWSLSPLAVNLLRIAFFRATAIGGNEAQDQGPMLAQIGISNTFDDRGISSINLAGYSSFGRSNGELGNVDNTWQLDEQCNYTRAGHSVAFGIGLRYRRGWHWNANVSALGVLAFQPVFTPQLGTNEQGQPAPLANTGVSFADFLLGIPLGGSVSGLPPIQFRAMQFAPFLQDRWRIRGSLTLNYGVAWSLETPPDPQGWARDAVHVFNRHTGLLEYSALGQTKPRVMETDWNNFCPAPGPLLEAAMAESRGGPRRRRHLLLGVPMAVRAVPDDRRLAGFCEPQRGQSSDPTGSVPHNGREHLSPAATRRPDRRVRGKPARRNHSNRSRSILPDGVCQPVERVASAQRRE